MSDDTDETADANDEGAEAAGANDVGAEAAGANDEGAEAAGANDVGAEAAGANDVGTGAAGANDVGTEAAGANDVGTEAAGATDVSTEQTVDDDEDDGGSFLGNLKNPRKQLGDAKEAFKSARGAGNLPRDADGRVKLVCRRHAEKRAVPLDDLGRPACYDEDHPDCRGCLEDVQDGSVEVWE